MPDVGQVHTACLRVMQLHGLAGVTTPNVEKMMRKVGVPAGSRRDLGPMVQDWKRQQRNIAVVPGHIVQQAQAFATTVWEMASAAAAEARLQEPLTAPRKRKTKPKQQLRSTPRLAALQTAVELLFRPNAPPAVLIRKPIRANDLLGLLTDKQRELTDSHHFSRDLDKIAKRSKLFCKVPGPGQVTYFRNEPVSSDGASPQKRKTYVKKGSPISHVRAANQQLMNDVLTVLAKVRAGLTELEIADRLGIAREERPKFFQMLRNQPRARKPRWTFSGDRYVAVRRKQALRSAGGYG
jgi:hypothetical protein